MPKTKLPPNLTSVRTLVTSVAPLARHCKLTPNGIYRWFKVNRIPAEHIIAVANFYDVEIGELLHLTGSDKSASPNPVLKPRNVLQTLVEVRAGNMTLAEAVEKTGQSEKTLKMVLIHWGEQIGTLYEVMEGLDKGEISLDEAAKKMGLAKYTIHGLRRKYGYAPGAVKRTRPQPTIRLRRVKMQTGALQVIAGRASAEATAREMGVSARNLFRYIEQMTDLSLTDLSRFPATFRLAYADEIEKKLPKYVQNWLKYAEKLNLYVQKQTKYPKTPENWCEAPLKRLLIGVLLGEGRLEEIAAARGGEPVILEGLFTAELVPLGLTYKEVKGMGMNHQTAPAELLIWQMDRKRRLPE